MKIVQIQIFSESTGRAAIRLHEAFVKKGIDSNMITLRPAPNDDKKIIQKGKSATIISRLDQLLQPFLNKNTIPKFGAFTYPILGSDISKMGIIQSADIIYIHWTLNGFLNLKSYIKLAETKKPIVFIMHDMWNITGGCHHSFTCEKYKSHCNNCQVFKKDKVKDLSYKGFNKKMAFYKKYKNLYFVSPSRWLYDCAKESALTKHKPIFHIPNLLNTSLFKPIDKSIAKKIFNLNPNEIIVSFGAISVDNPYKGWSYLISALMHLAKDDRFSNITLMVFGNTPKNEFIKQIPFKTIFTGFLRDEYSTMLVYNATDVFVAPSMADNLPTTILESLSCGTAVVGFKIGGIPDMIEHKKNGYLAEYKDAEDLATGIKFCLLNKISGKLPHSFDSEVILNQHYDLFNQVNSKIS